MEATVVKIEDGTKGELPNTWNDVGVVALCQISTIALGVVGSTIALGVGVSTIALGVVVSTMTLGVEGVSGDVVVEVTKK